MLAIPRDSIISNMNQIHNSAIGWSRPSGRTVTTLHCPCLLSILNNNCSAAVTASGATRKAAPAEKEFVELTQFN